MKLEEFITGHIENLVLTGNLSAQGLNDMTVSEIRDILENFALCLLLDQDEIETPEPRIGDPD